jgi:hypothetical protein
LGDDTQGDRVKVVHCKHEPYTIYIGRPSKFGNPFVIGKDGTREDVIRKFEVHAREHLMDDIAKLPVVSVLGCWCAPKPCHGDVIRKLWLELHNYLLGIELEVENELA